jgi:hypothetical protein
LQSHRGPAERRDRPLRRFGQYCGMLFKNVVDIDLQRFIVSSC